MRVAFVLIGLTLTCCAKIPAVQYPILEIETPDRWTATTNQSPDQQAETHQADSIGVSREAPSTAWWADLGDSVLTALIVEGLRSNHDLKAAAHRLEIAVAQARIAGAPITPQATAGVDASRSRRNFIGFPLGGGAGDGVVASETTGLNANILISWEVDLWGRMRAGHAAALADVGAAQADLAGARVSLAAQIGRLLFSVIEAQNQLDLAIATAANQDRTARQIEDRYDRGLRSSLDLRLARSGAASSRAAVAARRSQLDATKRSLETLLGRYPSATLSSMPDLPVVDGPVPAGMPAQLIQRRPDLAAGERRIRAAQLRGKQARRSLLPRISLTASGGRSSESLGDLLDGDYSVWNLVANLSQPLLQVGRLRAQVDLTAAAEEAALAEYAAIALRAYAQVEGALEAELSLAEQEQAMRVAASEARAAERVAQDRYARGLINYIALMESQQRAFSAQSQLLSVRRSRLEARVDLYVALGGGFSLSPSSSAPDTQETGT